MQDVLIGNFLPHNCISGREILPCNHVRGSSQRSSLITITLPTDAWGHREQGGMTEDQSETLHHLHTNICQDP